MRRPLATCAVIAAEIVEDLHSALEEFEGSPRPTCRDGQDGGEPGKPAGLTGAAEELPP